MQNRVFSNAGGNSMWILRSIVLALCLSVSGVAVGWVQSGYNVELAPPKITLAAIPHQLGDWNGEDVDIQAETVRVIGAHSYINRVYRDPVGREISLHAAAFTKPEFGGGTPHHPEVCFPAAGWEIIQRKSAHFTTEHGEVPIELMLFQKGTLRVVSAHWYQAGDLRFTGSVGLHVQSFGTWGRRARPCIQKFMLQISRPSISAAQPILATLASQLENSRQEIPGLR